MTDMLDKQNPEYKKYKFMMDLFKDETVFDAIDLIDGMSNAIGAFVRKDNLKRKLKDLTPDFL